MKCDYCTKPLAAAVTYDHGKVYHPDCFAAVCKEKMTEMVRKTLKNDWSMRLYES